VLGLMNDITDEAERQLREAELESALQRSQRLDAVGQLASGVAHDFNNLLMVVLGYAEILTDEEMSKDGHEYVTEIRRAASRGAALVRQLLAFGRRDKAQPQPLDLNEVVREMEPLLTRTLGAAVQLQLVMASEPSPIVADPVLVEQIVLNLAINARDAMPDGGVLYLATEHTHAATSGEPRVVLSVTDTGTGIDPAVRDTLFEPFVTTKGPGQGTGLGLATVASIVDAMGGAIDVVSAQGQGTTFEIALPLRGELVPALTEDEDVDVPAGNGERVLVVEDESAVRTALTKLLGEHGYVVTSCPGAEDALRMLDASSFDLVLTDLLMPNMTGVELLERIQRSRPTLPVVLMTGNSAGLCDDAACDAAAAVLKKPFARNELFRTLRNALAPVLVASPFESRG
jgi:CheY-like chemotaxis protein